MITRREFAAVAPAILTRSQQRRQPNLLFLMADDHAAYVMGCDNNRHALTPNLDALAAAGTRFAAHYCNSPVCTPSRQGLLTGQMPHSAGVTVLQTPLSPDKPTLSRQLKRGGYTTAVFGKMHFNRPAAPGLHGFDVMMTEGEITRAWQRDVKPADLPEGVETQTLPWRPFQTPARDWLNARKLPYPRRDAEMRGTYIARQAMQYMEENRNRRFALWVSLQEPHSPFDFPLEDCGLFDPRNFEPPRIGRRDDGQIPLIFRDLTVQEKQGIIAAYYTSAHFMDRNFGRVLAKLRELGLEDNTLVIYTADHGYDLGHHGRFEKHCGYDQALRVPLLLRWPGHVREGVVTCFSEHIDLAPTLIDMLGAPPLEVQHGRSLRPYLAGRANVVPRSHVISAYLENEEVFVRAKRWKLIYCSGKRARTDGYKTDNPTPGRSVRLLDLRMDPGEFEDVSGKNPQVVKELKEHAIARFRSTHPDAEQEPSQSGIDDALDFYLRPRDAKPA